MTARQTPRQLRDTADIMSVALAQPHRRGISSLPADAWQATALGRFCRRYWSAEAAHEHWLVGERFAQLIDAERISRGFSPRQCAEVQTVGSGMTLAEKLAAREGAGDALRDARIAIGSIPAIDAIMTLSYDDRDIFGDHSYAYDGLYRLKTHFDRLDRPKNRR